MSFNNKR